MGNASPAITGLTADKSEVLDNEAGLSTAWSTNNDKILEACYVRALYPFSSTESSSLAFRPGDLIRVLTKLESGWWDGLLNGHRGWFPSNYVEEVEIVSSDEEDAENGCDGLQSDNGTAATTPAEPLSPFRSTFSAAVHTSPVVTEKPDSADAAYWIPQSTSEGRIYFFNTVTGESKWDVPFETLDRVTSSATIAARKLPITTGMRPPMSPDVTSKSQGANGTSAIQSPAISSTGLLPSNNLSGWTEIDGERSQPTTSGKETTDSGDQNGEVLLFAMPEENNVDTFDHHFFTTGLNTRVLAGNQQAASPVAEQRQAVETQYSVMTAPVYSDVSPYLVDEVERAMSATSLHDWPGRLAAATSSLKSTVLARDFESYDLKVEQIRALVSGFAQSAGLHLPATSNECAAAQFKTQYRQLLATLSKMTLSVHNAKNKWIDESCAEKMLDDAAMLNRLVLQIVMELERSQVRPTGNTLVPAMIANRPVGGGWHGNGITGVDSEIMATISGVPFSNTVLLGARMFSQSIYAGLNGCRQKLNDYREDPTALHSSAILRDTIEIVSRTRELLSTTERIDFSSCEFNTAFQSQVTQAFFDFAKAKQAMYNAIAKVILHAQDLTRTEFIAQSEAAKSASEALLVAFVELETAVKVSTSQTEVLLHEVVQPPRGSSTPSIRGGSQVLDSPTRAKLKKERSNDSVPASPSLDRSSMHNRASYTNSNHLGEAEETPWYLDHELESDLTYDSKGNVKAGTLLALVERLTRHDHLDSMYNNTFLLTYKSFCTAEELSTLLMQRFLIQPPAGLTPEQTDIWIEQKQQPIRLRVFNIMKCWMEQFFQERHNEQTKQWLAQFKDFVENVMSEHMLGAGVLVWMLEQRMLHGDEVLLKKMVMNNTVPAPLPILPKNIRKIKLLDLDPLEIARQLTLMESELYNRIKPFECLDKSWSKPDSPEEAENIKAMILNSNQITAWVAEAILFQTDLKKRVSLIKHFVLVAERCKQLNNFSTLTAIISGLNSAPIHRLRRTWSLLNQRVALTAEDLNRLMNSSKNFSQYREALHQTQPPCVPFLGVYLTDLTFIEDGNPNMSVKARHLINISKRMKTAEVIRDIQQYQATPYSLTMVPEIQNYIKSCMEITRDISELYDISLEREPREREDEKIARLLQESGFL